MESTPETQSNSAATQDTESLETVETVIISGPLKGKFVYFTMTTDGTVGNSITKLTPEEMEVLRAFAEASKKAETPVFRESESAQAIVENSPTPTETTPDQPSQPLPTDN